MAAAARSRGDRVVLRRSGHAHEQARPRSSRSRLVAGSSIPCRWAPCWKARRPRVGSRRGARSPRLNSSTRASSCWSTFASTRRIRRAPPFDGCTAGMARLGFLSTNAAYPRCPPLFRCRVPSRAVGDNAPITPALAVAPTNARARWVARRAHLHGAAPRTNQRGERAVHGDGDGDGQARAVARRCDRAWRSRRGRSDAGENGVRTSGRHMVTVEVTWNGTYVVLDRERSARLFRHDGRRRQHRRSELHRHWRGGRHLLAPAA